MEYFVYRLAVNHCLEPHTYTSPESDDILSKLIDPMVFAKINLKCAYIQILLDESPILVIAVSSLTRKAFCLLASAIRYNFSARDEQPCARYRLS